MTPSEIAAQLRAPNVESTRFWQAVREAAGMVEDKAGLRRALAIAKGCEDYSGGYRDKELEIYHHGMDTVRRCIQAAIDGDNSLQLRVVEAIGGKPRAGTTCNCAIEDHRDIERGGVCVVCGGAQ